MKSSVAVIGLLLLLSTILPAQQYIFNRASFPAGDSPADVAIADFNGDGRADVAVLNGFGNAVSVLLGQPDGTFGPKMDFSSALGVGAIVAADFNHDGKVDLAVSELAGDVVSIFMGHGDGTFATGVDYPTGHVPFGMVTGDFNGDGKIDIATADIGCNPAGCQPGAVSILLGKGDGTFQPKVDYPVGSEPNFLVTQDFNGDGKLDIAATNNSSNDISILVGNGNGTFKNHVEYPTAAGPAGIAAADFNGDHIMDLVVTHYGPPWAITVLKGNGDGSFQAEQEVGELLATGFIRAVDVNADGKTDLIVPAVSQGGVLIFLGKGDGTFQSPVTYAATPDVGAVAVQDVSGDGNLDLIVANSGPGSITVLLGNGDGRFSPRMDLPLNISDPTQLFPLTPITEDFDSDGVPDLAMGEGTAGLVAVLRGKGKGQFQPPQVSSVGTTFRSIASGDFNGDGHADLVISSDFGGFRIMLGRGDGLFNAALTPVPIPSIVRGVATGDFNHDGKQDLAILGNRFEQTKPLYLFLGKGDGTFQTGLQSWDSNTVPFSVVSGDFNHDGKLDLALLVNPNGVAILIGNGDGTFQTPILYPTDDLPSGFIAADVNHDGILDIIAVAQKIDVLLGNGDGTFQPFTAIDGGDFPQNVVVGDFNGDGKVDIIAMSSGTAALGAIEILFGNGDGTFQPRVEITCHGTAAAVEDLNQDGISDLVVGGNSASIFLSGPMAIVSPSVVQFGSAGVGSTSADQAVKLTNTGNAPLTLSNAAATAGYKLTSDCDTSLAIGVSCDLQVAFNPQAVGASSGTLTLTDNSPGGRQVISLAGTGAGDFTLALSSGSSDTATTSAGGTANYALDLNSSPGFAVSVALTCSSSSVPFSTCTVTPSPVSLNGIAASTVTVKVTTTARTQAMLLPGNKTDDRSQYRVTFAALLLPLGLLLIGYKQKQNARALALIFAVALISFTSVSCGGGSSGGGGGGHTGTPAGNYTVTVTGTNSGASVEQHQIQLKLAVN